MSDVVVVPVHEGGETASVHEDEAPADENYDDSSASGEAEVGGGDGDDSFSVLSLPTSL